MIRIDSDLTKLLLFAFPECARNQAGALEALCSVVAQNPGGFLNFERAPLRLYPYGFMVTPASSGCSRTAVRSARMDDNT